MYTTIEADIERGRVKSPELQKLPDVAHVLITWLGSSTLKTPNWSRIETQLGKLKLRDEPADWQRKIRSEWN